VRIVISDDVLNVVVLSTFRCCVCMIELLIEAPVWLLRCHHLVIAWLNRQCSQFGEVISVVGGNLLRFRNSRLLPIWVFVDVLVYIFIVCT